VQGGFKGWKWGQCLVVFVVCSMNSVVDLGFCHKLRGLCLAFWHLSMSGQLSEEQRLYGERNPELRFLNIHDCKRLNGFTPFLEK